MLEVVLSKNWKAVYSWVGNVWLSSLIWQMQHTYIKRWGIESSIEKYWKRIVELDMSKVRRKISTERVTSKRILQFQSRAVLLIYMRNFLLPQAASVAFL